MGWDKDVGDLSDAVHGFIALDDVHGEANGVIFFEVVVVEDRIAGEDGQALLRLNSECLAAQGMSAHVEGTDAGQDL